MGVRVAGKLPAALDYGVEMAMQRGSLGDRLRQRLGRPLADSRVAPRSRRGQADRRNTTSRPATTTRPTARARRSISCIRPDTTSSGLADQVGWTNIHHLREGVRVHAVQGPPPISLNYHSWWLAEKTDALYSGGGALLARVAGGAADSHVGQELDVQVARALTPQIQVAAGYAHISRGRF